ncbi:MAG: hypothetical protein NTY19_20115 [Planctomycetota bacterium]|nr:hypothetical protein [Planctomycetota bacterium]
MKIIAVHKGFACDHSSTSYEFLAMDKPLGEKARRAVSALSSRANPTGRRVSFIYHAEGYDIPGGWEKLMREYYDVMHSESYGWWTFAMAFDAPKKQQEALRPYAFSGTDDLGVSVSCDGRRVTVAVHCHADADSLYRIEDGYEDDGDDFEEADEESEEDEAPGSATFESEDGLLNLLNRVRQQLIDGDYRAMFAVWEVYGEDDEEDAPPRPPDRKQGKDVVEEFRALLATE